nr:phosphoribosylaminoimidazolesuccinocarboxamide synthase [uncultured Sphaerochaeta sp.]
MHLFTPVLEFCYKRDDLDDPMVNAYHIQALSLATDEQVPADHRLCITYQWDTFFLP